MFEKDNLHRYERFYMKLVNYNVRFAVLKEVFLVRQFNIYPFDMLQCKDVEFLEKKIKVVYEKTQLEKIIQQKIELRKSYINN